MQATQQRKQHMPLKQLELVVDESVPGHFYWLVLGPEIYGEPREVFAYAQGPCRTLRTAMDEGTAALAWQRENFGAVNPHYAKTVLIERQPGSETVL